MEWMLENRVYGKSTSVQAMALQAHIWTSVQDLWCHMASLAPSGFKDNFQLYVVTLPKIMWKKIA